jgi:hypothetical protein
MPALFQIMSTKLRHKLIVGILLLSGSIAYSFPILYAEESSQQNARLLQACLDKADQKLLGNFRVLCRTNDKIIGGTEHGKNACYKAIVEDTIGYMTYLNTTPAICLTEY